jgi:hypothetical protein
MLIYRGVNKALDLESKGQILAKGSIVERGWTCDTTLFTFDNIEVTFEDSKENAVYQHQHELVKTDDSAWISCSVDYSVAKKFATLGGTVEGYVYVLETDLFEDSGVEMIGVLGSAPEKHEREVSIRHINVGAIPNRVIVEKHCV